MQVHGQPVVEGRHVRGREQQRVPQPGVAPRVEPVLVLGPRQLGALPEQVAGDVRLVAGRGRAPEPEHVPHELQVDVRQRALHGVQLAGRGGAGVADVPAGLSEQLDEPEEGRLQALVAPHGRAQGLEPLQAGREMRPGKEALQIMDTT